MTLASHPNLDATVVEDVCRFAACDRAHIAFSPETGAPRAGDAEMHIDRQLITINVALIPLCY